MPKLSSQDEEGGAGIGFPAMPAHFEPIPHDHDFCERVVINVCFSFYFNFSCFSCYTIANCKNSVFINDAESFCSLLTLPYSSELNKELAHAPSRQNTLRIQLTEFDINSTSK